MSRFGYNCRKTRRNLLNSLPDWNCECGQHLCINSFNEFDPDGCTHAGVKTLISRDYYHGSFDGGSSSSNIISHSALKSWRAGKSLTKDHAFTPQLFGRLVMDNPHIYLSDDEESISNFNELYFLASTIIMVTAEENTLLRGQTHNRNDVFKLEVHTYLKYRQAGIKLLEKKEDETWIDAKPISNILKVPDMLTHYERKYLVEYNK